MAACVWIRVCAEWRRRPGGSGVVAGVLRCPFGVLCCAINHGAAVCIHQQMRGVLDSCV